MLNTFISVIRRTTPVFQNEAAPLNAPVKKAIEELSKRDFCAVAGGPQVENDPES